MTNLFDEFKPEVTKRFEAFHRDNPHLYAKFCEFALKAAAKRDRFSARTILHLLRWWAQIETDDPAGYKVNDHWSPFYARMFERDHPEHGGFFVRRRAAADES